MHPRQMRETDIPVLPSFAYCMITPCRRSMLFCPNSGAHSPVSRPQARVRRSWRSGLRDCGMTRTKVVAVVMNELRGDVSKQDRIYQHRREDNCHEHESFPFRSIWRRHDPGQFNISTSNLVGPREAISLTAA